METKKPDKKEAKDLKDLKEIKEIKEGAPFAALSYVLFLWILTFIFKKDNRFAYFHAKQGIVIFFAKAICLALTFLPLLGGLFKFFGLILVFVSLRVVYLSLRGRCARIYLVSNIADKLIL